MCVVINVLKSNLTSSFKWHDTWAKKHLQCQWISFSDCVEKFNDEQIQDSDFSIMVR